MHPATTSGHSRYPLVLVTLVLAGLALVATFCRYVDPYRIFSADRDAVHTAYPALHANLRLHKTHQVNLQRPDAIILGTSTAIQGFPLDHPRFDGRRVYNLAMPLATMEENARLLRHALANAPIEDVVLSLDFLSFNAYARTDGPAAGFVPGRLKGSPDGKAEIASDRLAALLSLDALRASVAVLRGAEGGTHRVMTGLGGREDAEIRSRLADGGHASNTRRIEAFFTDAVYLPAPHREFAFAANGTDSFFWFEDFLRTVHTHELPATLVIGPSHARLPELIHAMGLWPVLEDWKRRLVAGNERVAAEFDRAPLALWDFSAPGPVTTEPFPAPGDADTRMAGYYESIHFNQRTGALVLDRISSDDGARDVDRGGGDVDSPDREIEGDPTARVGADAETASVPFGIRLTGANLERVLAAIRGAQAVFRAADPERSRELSDLVEGVVGDRFRTD